jgi:hypothetical protein
MQILIDGAAQGQVLLLQVVTPKGCMQQTSCTPPQLHGQPTVHPTQPPTWVGQTGVSFPSPSLFAAASPGVHRRRQASWQQVRPPGQVPALEQAIPSLQDRSKQDRPAAPSTSTSTSTSKAGGKKEARIGSGGENTKSAGQPAICLPQPASGLCHPCP